MLNRCKSKHLHLHLFCLFLKLQFIFKVSTIVSKQPKMAIVRLNLDCCNNNYNIMLACRSEQQITWRNFRCNPMDWRYKWAAEGVRFFINGCKAQNHQHAQNISILEISIQHNSAITQFPLNCNYATHSTKS